MSLGYAFAKDRNQIRILLSILITKRRERCLIHENKFKEVGYIYLALPAMCSVSSLS